jgi:AcrR family transcriptional regulator
VSNGFSSSQARIAGGEARPKPAGPRRPLTRDRVLATALRLIDDHGLEQLSMRKLGAELGVEAMSLYNHVPSKAALLQGVAELSLRELELPGPEVTDWRERLKVGLRSLRQVANHHPGAYRLFVTQRLTSPAVVRPVEVAFGALCSAGFDDDTAVYAFHTLVGFVLGYVLQEQGGPFGTRTGEFAAAYDQLPDGENGHQRVEALTPSLRAAAANADSDAEFEFGLDTILGGLASRLEHSPTP